MAVTTTSPSLFGRAFAGAGTALSRWPLVLALYLPSLLIGLVSALPVFSAGQTLAGLGPWTDKIVDGNAVTVFLEASLSVPTNVETAGMTLPQNVASALSGFGVAALIVLLGVLLQGLAYNVLAGGVLDGLAGRTSRPFWRACLHWTGPMLLFAAAGAGVMLLLGGLGLVLIAIVPAGSLADLLVKPLVAGLWLGCLNGLFEFGRADMVSRDDPRALAAIGRAFGLLAHPMLFLQALVVWVILAVVGAAYWGATGAGVGAVPVGGPAVGLIVGQVFALGGALLKLIRLAIALAMADAVRDTATG